VLLDTCVLVDALQDRQPFAKDAQELFLAAANHRFVGCTTAKAATDIYYLMHRYTHDDKASRLVLSKLFVLFDVLDTAGLDCRRAIPAETADFEDAVMIETALRTEMDAIVTRNTKDYTKAPLPVYTPGEFLHILTREEP
jgi:predicted nucleic acid-binding protein